MESVRVALAQIEPKLGDVASNVEVHVDAIRRARKAGATLVVFPELSLTGYLLQDQVPAVARRLDASALSPLLRASRQIDVVVGLVEEAEDHRFFNAAAYLARGGVLHVHRKIYLPTYGMFDEGRDFAPGDRLRAFQASFGPCGVLICEDCWHPMCSWLLAQQGAQVLLALSNGPTRGASPDRGITSLHVWEELLRVTARVQTSFVVYVNRVGYEDGVNFGGGSFVMDPFGRKVASLPGLDPGFAVAELDPEVLRRARTSYPLLRDENLELAFRELSRIRALRFDLPDEDGRIPASEDRPVGRPGARRRVKR